MGQQTQPLSMAGWIRAKEVARRLGISPTSVPNFAEANGIRRRIMPGVWTTYHEGDVAAIMGRVVIVGPGVPPRDEAGKAVKS